MHPAVALAAGTIAAAWAPAPSTAPVYCSPSGDVCKAVRKVDGRWTISITTAALYASGTRYRLCVRDPRRRETCRQFRLREDAGGSFSSSIVWRRHFPNGGKGRYRVRWNHEGITYGPPLTFVRT